MHNFLSRGPLTHEQTRTNEYSRMIRDTRTVSQETTASTRLAMKTVNAQIREPDADSLFDLNMHCGVTTT